MQDTVQKLQLVADFFNKNDVNSVLEVIKFLQGQQHRLVGHNQFSTVVNAVTLDVNANLLQNIIKTNDSVKSGTFFPDNVQ